MEVELSGAGGGQSPPDTENPQPSPPLSLGVPYVPPKFLAPDTDVRAWRDSHGLPSQAAE